MVSLPRDTDELADVTFLRHEACPDCGSSDALAVYDDGHTYCFSCQTYTDPNKTSHSSDDGDLLRGYPVQLRSEDYLNKHAENTVSTKTETSSDSIILTAMALCLAQKSRQ